MNARFKAIMAVTAVALASGGALATAGVAHAAAQAPASQHGCSDGAVCMYTDDDWNQGTPEHFWTTYKCYNLQDETGHRYVLNNQYGGATATLWTGYNCTGKSVVILEGTTWQGDIGPINSISVDNDG